MSWAPPTPWPGRPAIDAGYGVARAAPSWSGAGGRRESERIIPGILAVIGAQLILQIAAAVWIVAADPEPDVAIRVSLIGTLTFYGATAAFVLWRFADRPVRPVWSTRQPVRSALLGVAVGLAQAIPVLALVSAAAGHWSSDSFAVLVASERDWGRIVAAAIVLSVCAPLVEEWLFRGLLAESLRTRGRWAALLVSAVLFAAWHLRPTALQYYVIVGVILGALYLSRGLVASMSAHATFNGTLLLVAVLLAHGPSHVIQGNDVALRLPATWHEIDSGTDDFAARGPSGARVSVVHDDRLGLAADAPLLARRLRDGDVRLDLGSFSFDPATAVAAHYRAGDYVRLRGRVSGHRAEGVLAPRVGRLWSVVLETAGSHRAAEDFEHVLRRASFGSGVS